MAPLNSCRPACSFTGLQSNMALGRGWGGGHGKHTRSTAADQPALLPDYKVTWLWVGGGGIGGGMVSTPAQLLQTSLLLTGLQSNMALGRGWGMISTPAQLLQTSLLLTGLQSNMALGRGWGMISTPAQQLQTSLLLTGLQSNMALGRGWGMISTPAQLLQTSLLLYRITK